MKRRLLTLAIFLLLGAVVNVAVAWGCAITINVFAVIPYGASNPVGDDHWSVNRWRRPGGARISSTRYRKGHYGRTNVSPFEVIPEWGRLANPMDEFYLDSTAMEQRVIDARGWPMLSLWCEVESTHHSDDYGTVRAGIHGGINGGIEAPLLPQWRVVAGLTQPRVLPLRPIWRGFLTNSLLYAAILWIVLFARRDVRQFIRRKRGLCLACGYDLRHADHAACPECGAGALNASPITLG